MRHLASLAMATAMVALSLFTIDGPAQAKVPGPSGQITLGRFDPAVGDQVVYAMNPDGSDLHRVIPGTPIPGECPHWSPDGSTIATCGTPDGGATRLIDPSTGTFRDLAMPDPTLFTACDIWSPSGKRLACESFGQNDPNRNGLYTIRTSDGRGLKRVTSNPNGDDLPGDYSPTGAQIVFGRSDPTRSPAASQALFVVNIGGSGLRRITPWGLGACCGSWSRDGRWILFAGAGKLYVVHPDGTGLKQIPLATGGGSYSASHPAWSPDGTMMVFSLLLPANGALDIYTAKANGSDLTQLTTALPGAADAGEGDEVPDWGPHSLST